MYVHSGSLFGSDPEICTIVKFDVLVPSVEETVWLGHVAVLTVPGINIDFH